MRLGFALFFISTVFVILVKCDRINVKTRSYDNCVSCMVEVLQLENKLLLNLQNYKVKLKEKCDIIKFYVDYVRKEHKRLDNKPEKYLSNSLNAFRLLRRMHADWFKWQDFMKQTGSNKAVKHFIETIQYKMPTSNDLLEASAGIFHIQETNDMKAKDISMGFLNGIQYNVKFLALDCFAIGQYLRSERKYDLALSWFDVSVKIYSELDDKMSEIFITNIVDVYFSIAEVYFSLGDIYNCRKAILRGLEQRPNDNFLIQYGKYIQRIVSHEELCRGDIPQMSPGLKCRYNSTTTPFLKLAPMKMEEISMDPYIVVYHDVIYDSEIEELKRLALPDLERGEIEEGAIDPDKTTQMVRFFSNESILVERINRRMVDISGLIFSENLLLQVVNYGIGGHYSSHYDFYHPDAHTHLLKTVGNRLAAIIFYMSDVDQGGGTAFPEINKVIQPKKGSAILWYHLDNSGEPNFNTLHASCPVLVGSKWITIRLAYYWPQMFTKPCYK